MQKIGPCNFSELPQLYRDQFESGSLRSATAKFFPYEPSSSALSWAIFFSFIYILPALIVIYAGPYYIYQDPTLLPRIIEDMTSGLLQFLVVITLFGVVAWGTYFMLNMGWRSLARAAAWIKTKRATAVGKQHYGLLLDEQNLVLRHGEHFADYTCAFLLKSAIKECSVSKVRVWFPKRSFDIKVVKVLYVDEQKQLKELELREHFSMSAPELCDQIQGWLRL